VKDKEDTGTLILDADNRAGAESWSLDCQCGI